MTTSVPTQTMPLSVPVRTTQLSATGTRPSLSGLTRRVVVLIVGVLQVLLVLRVFLTLLEANPSQPLVRGLHVLSQPFVTPFVGMFASPRPTVLGGPIEVPAIAALLADDRRGARLGRAGPPAGAPVGRVKIGGPITSMWDEVPTWKVQRRSSTDAPPQAPSVAPEGLLQPADLDVVRGLLRRLDEIERVADAVAQLTGRPVRVRGWEPPTADFFLEVEPPRG